MAFSESTIAAWCRSADAPMGQGATRCRRARPRTAAASEGFTLLEITVVLLVIGLVIGAISIGRDVHRSAVNQRIASEFVQGWLSAYESYRLVVGVVPGDDPAAPTGAVNGTADAPLCGADLRNAMLARGIEMPAGRAEGANDTYVYLDSNGLPQQLAVCFVQIPWAEPGATGGSVRVLPRNVMRLAGLTPSLATALDHFIDGRVDARFGSLRELSAAASTSVASLPWSADDRDGMGGGIGRDENQVVNLTAALRMAY